MKYGACEKYIHYTLLTNTFFPPRPIDIIKLHIPGHRLPVKDVFYEPFRWNQTLNTVDMVPDGVEANPKIREMSDAMGGMHLFIIQVFTLSKFFIGVYSRVTSLNDLLIFVNSCVNHKYKSNSTTPQFHEGVIVVLVEYGMLSSTNIFSNNFLRQQ